MLNPLRSIIFLKVVRSDVPEDDAARFERRQRTYFLRESNFDDLTGRDKIYVSSKKVCSRRNSIIINVYVLLSLFSWGSVEMLCFLPLCM